VSRSVRQIRHCDVLGVSGGVAIGEQLTAVVANYMASVVSMSARGKDAPTRIGHRHEPGRNWPASGRGCAKESPERVVQQPVRTSTGVGSIRHCDVLIPAGRGRGRALAAGGQGSVTSSHSDYLSAIRHRGRSRSVRAASRIGGGGGAFKELSWEEVRVRRGHVHGACRWPGPRPAQIDKVPISHIMSTRKLVIRMGCEYVDLG
jgi:hypothetical protein